MEKDASKALSLKEKGNSEYKQKRLASSIQYYTEALFFAPCLSFVLSKTADTFKRSCDDEQLKTVFAEHNIPPTDKGVKDSLIVAHCYGNRSAALLELKNYEAALVDVNLAMYHGYPEEEFKIYKRKALCLSHLGRKSEALEVIQTYKEVAKHLVPTEKVEKNVTDVMKDIREIKESDSKENDKELKKLFMSSSLLISKTPDKGRCIMAKKDIPFGVCVMSETPYVSLLNKKYTHTHCSYCFKETLNIIPCCYCIFSGYCSVSCMETAWKHYHWAECTHGKELQYYDELTEGLLGLTVRFLLTSLIDVKVLLEESIKSDMSSAIALLTKEGSTGISDNYKLALQLAPAVMIEKFKKGVDKIIEVYSVILSSYFKSSMMMVSINELLLLHMLQVQANVMAIAIDVPQKTSLTCRDWDRVAFGSGLYLTASIFNHSCDYNLSRNFIGNRVEVSANQAIVKGHELCITYVPGSKLGYTKKTDRQKMIKWKQRFDCSCFVCASPTKDILRREYGWYGLLCPKCNGLLPEPDEINFDKPVMSECIDCSQSTDVIPLLKLKSEVLSKKERTLGDIQGSYKILSKLLYKYNTKIVDYCMKIMSCFAEKGDYRSALVYSNQRCDIVEAIHGSYSMQLADALFDHCHVLISCGEIRTSKQVARRTLMLLEFHYGTDDDTKQLREFLQ